jgi:hypothetical protein
MLMADGSQGDRGLIADSGELIAGATEDGFLIAED